MRSRERFAAIPEWAFKNPVMLKPPTNLVIYTSICLLSNYKDRTGDPDWKELAAMTGMSRTAIYRGLKALKAAGIICLREDGMYDLPMDRPCGKESQSRDFTKSKSQSRDGKSQSRDETVPIAGFALSSTEVDSESSQTRDARSSREVMFDHIWEKYPRKLNRKGALKAFLTRCNEVSPNDLAQAAENYRLSVLGKDQDHIMHGSTFFGPNERWKDYLDAPVVSNGSCHPHVNRDGDPRTLDELLLAAQAEDRERGLV